MKACSVRRVERDVNGPDRFFRRAAARARDARRREADRRPESLARAERHLARGLFRDRPVPLERGGRDAHEVGLRRVRVRHRRAEEVLRRARDVRQAPREEAGFTAVPSALMILCAPSSVAVGIFSFSSLQM